MPAGGGGKVNPGISSVPCRKKSYVQPEHTPTVLPFKPSTDVISLSSATAIDDGVK